MTALKDFAALLAVALLLGPLAAACDGGDEDDTGLQELQALAGEASEGIIAKVTYRYQYTAAGESGEVWWVLVQRPPDSRIEIAGEEGGAVRNIIISAGGKYYLCATNSFFEGDCMITEAEEAEGWKRDLDPLFQIPHELAEGAEDLDLVTRSERQIAGVNAKCFTVSGALSGLGEGEGEVCFSDDGLLLYLGGETTGLSYTIEATSVSTDVTDADFEPPYEIKEPLRPSQSGASGR